MCRMIMDDVLVKWMLNDVFDVVNSCSQSGWIDVQQLKLPLSWRTFQCSPTLAPVGDLGAASLLGLGDLSCADFTIENRIEIWPSTVEIQRKITI